jgi:hypothetical protein
MKAGECGSRCMIRIGVMLGRAGFRVMIGEMAPPALSKELAHVHRGLELGLLIRRQKQQAEFRNALGSVGQHFTKWWHQSSAKTEGEQEGG